MLRRGNTIDTGNLVSSYAEVNSECASFYDLKLFLNWDGHRSKESNAQTYGVRLYCFTWCLCWRKSSFWPEKGLLAFVSHQSSPLMQWLKWGSFPRFSSGVKSWPFEVCNKTHRDSSPQTCKSASLAERKPSTLQLEEKLSGFLFMLYLLLLGCTCIPNTIWTMLNKPHIGEKQTSLHANKYIKMWKQS